MSAIDGLSSIASSFSTSLFSTSQTAEDSSFADLLALLQGDTSDTSNDMNSWIDDIIGSTSGSSSWMDTLFSADTITTDSGEYLSLDGVSDMFSSTFNDFTNLASSLFSASGITNFSATLTIQATGVGGLSCSSSDSGLASDAGNAVSGNTELTSDFMIAAAFASISYAASTDSQFSADYNDDPAATMEKYEATLKDYLLSFQINFSASGTSYSFADSDDSSASATASSTPASSSVVA